MLENKITVKLIHDGECLKAKRVVYFLETEGIYVTLLVSI